MSTAPRSRIVRTIPLGVLALLGLLASAGTASADTAAPQLSIQVTDEQTEARSGDTLHYVVTVTNLGAERVRDLAVTQTVAPIAKLASVGDGGAARKGVVGWTVDVPANKSVTLRTSVVVGQELPADVLRLASVACAGTSPKAAPTVCASDSDQLPAGAAAVDQQRQVETAAAAGQRPDWLLPAGGVLGGLAAVGALVVASTRRKRRDAAGHHAAVGSAEGARLPRRGAGPEEVAGAEPGAREVLQR